MARKIMVTSGKGGVGKTTVCCNLAVQLARRGLRVIVCDLDFGLNNVDVLFGMENLANYDLIDVVEGNCRARQALVKHPRYSTLYTLTSNRIPESCVSPQAVKLVLETLSPQFDFILLDCPAGVGAGFRRAAACAEEAILVTTPHISAMRDADRVAGLLQSYRFSSVGLVVNLVRKEMARRGEVLSTEDIAAALHLPILAVIPEDEKFYLDNISERSRAFHILADCLTVEKEEKRGIFATWGRKR